MKAFALSVIAEVYGKLNQPEEAAKLLQQALDSANLIDIKEDDKARALSAIIKAIGKLNQPQEATKLLQQALDSANQIGNTGQKTETLVSIAQAQANLKNWGEALTVTKECSEDACHVQSLAAVLTVYAEQKHPQLEDKGDAED